MSAPKAIVGGESNPTVASLLAQIAQELRDRFPWLVAEPWRSKVFAVDDDHVRLVFTGAGGFMIRRAGRDSPPIDTAEDALIVAAQVDDIVRAVVSWDTNRPEVKIAQAKRTIAAVLDDLLEKRTAAERKDA